MTEKAQEKKPNVTTNLQIFDGHLIPNENKMCITGKEKPKDKICKVTK